LYKIDKKIVSRHVWNKTLLECAKNHTNQLRRFTVKQGGFILGPRCSLYWLNYCLIKTFRSSKITVSWTKTYGWRNHQQIHKFAKYAWQVCQLIEVNPLMGIWKPHSNGPLYNNTVIGTLAVDWWAVTFGTARKPSPLIAEPSVISPTHQRLEYQLHVSRCGTTCIINYLCTIKG